MGRIWLIGGTQESALLAEAIASAQLPCTITVTTDSARNLYPTVPTLRVWVGKLSSHQLEEFWQHEQIIAILDASHPYASQISESVIALARCRKIPYLRYERPHIYTDNNQADITYIDKLDTIILGDYLDNQRVLLTIGYRQLHLFSQMQTRSTLFARLMPSKEALEAANKAGFTATRLICIRPPVPEDLEKALWRHWDISVVVTKASGSAGGEDIKRQVATDLGIPLIVITRPDITYPQQTSDVSVALEFCRQYCVDADIW